MEKEMKFKIIADYAENFDEFENSKDSYNDHMYAEEIEQINDAIRRMGYDCSIFGGVEKLLDSAIDKEKLQEYYFLNFSDGLTQEYSRLQVPVLCELLNLKYSGSTPFPVALMNNKHYSKLAVEEIRVLVPKGVLIETSADLCYIKQLNFPVILKPNTGGSSDGITQDCIKHNVTDAIDKANELLKKGYEIIAEEYIAGYEATTLIIGNKNDIKLNETIVYEFGNKLYHDSDLLDANYKANNNRKGYPATQIFDQDFCDKISNVSIKIYNHLKVNDMARIDYRITRSGEIYFIEINSQPGINIHSEGGYICKFKGISFGELYHRYIQTFIKRIDTNRGSK